MNAKREIVSEALRRASQGEPVALFVTSELFEQDRLSIAANPAILRIEERADPVRSVEFWLEGGGMLALVQELPIA